jgi:hypothetical protein
MIKYKKGNANKLADTLSRPPAPKLIVLGTRVHMEPFTHEAYKENTLKMRTLRRYFSSCKVKRLMKERRQQG